MAPPGVSRTLTHPEGARRPQSARDRRVDLCDTRTDRHD
jgi:hypothetical protein